LRSIVEGERRVPLVKNADVVVVGAGLAGVSAAVAAARAGADTLLIERNAFPGGISTSSLMSSISNFYFTRRNRRVARGIASEILENLADAGGAPPGPLGPEVPQIPNDPEKMKVVLIELLRRSGVETLYHTRLSSVPASSRRVLHIVVENSAGRQAIEGRVFVDATGDADLVWKAGGTVESVGGSASLEMRFSNVHLDDLVEYFDSNPGEYDALIDVETSLEDFKKNWRERGIFHLPHGNGPRISIIRKAVTEGAYPRELGLVNGLDALGMYGLRDTATVIVNTGFVGGGLLDDPLLLSRAEEDARIAAQRVARFLQENMPGFEDAVLVATGDELGIRITRRIVASYRLTRAEIESSARFHDAIAVGAERRIGGQRLEEGFDIPYRITLPAGVKGVVAASGKTVSTEPPGTLRGQVLCMQLGQATGVAAALSASNRIAPDKIPARQLQSELLRQGVYLGEKSRLEQLGLVGG